MCWGADHWGCRRIWVHIRSLPAESLFGGGWGVRDELLAQAVEQLRTLNYIEIVARGGKAEPPQPLPRPSHDRSEPELPSTADLAAFLRE